MLNVQLEYDAIRRIPYLPGLMLNVCECVPGAFLPAWMRGSFVFFEHFLEQAKLAEYVLDRMGRLLLHFRVGKQAGEEKLGVD
jgi:hypothetical protein